MGNLSAYFDRILTLWPRIERTANSSVASTAAHSEMAGKDAKTKEQPGNEARSLLETLPAIAAITATTDIRAFLKPGVPDMLKHAALRRAWATDLAIRDFVGIAENQWDFNKPQDIPGFGLLDPSENIQRLVPTISIDPSTKSENAPERQLELQKASENLVRLGAPGIDSHPARMGEAETKASAKPEGSKQNDV